MYKSFNFQTSFSTESASLSNEIVACLRSGIVNTFSLSNSDI
jgi:hypothetical protein